ncbi:MAG: hypothetical protein E3K37_04315 [Candidatus Kuenenia sp.]|nr:hypothetical protein [Candidatus Kuenenia hertensis]
MQINKKNSYTKIIFVLFAVIFGRQLYADNNKSVEIFVNRGILEEAPENTFAALNRAVELGVDGILVDVRRTKDGRLILMNDETIDRTTDGMGRVDQLLYSELQQYDAGLWRGIEFKGERVPLLSDVLMFCKINKLKLILNVKQIFLEEQVAELVRTYEMFPQVYWWGAMRSFNSKSPESPGKGLVYVSPGGLNEEKLKRIREEKKYSFTSILENDDRRIMKKAIRKGVDVLLVDYPYVAMDVLNMNTLVNSAKEIKKIQPESRPIAIAGDDPFINQKLKTLLKTLQGADKDESRTAAITLAVLPPKYTVPPLLKLLKKKNAEIKQNAVWSLSFCGNSTIAAQIEPLLDDKNTGVRREAALALKRLVAIQSVQALIDRLQIEPDINVKYDIARALSTLGNQNSAFPLFEVLGKEKNWLVKEACIEAVSNTGNDKAITILYDILVADSESDASFARTKAAWALASMGEKAVPFLIKALQDNEESARRKASWALIKIGAPAVMSLISSLNDVNEHTRSRAAQILGWLGDARSVTPLVWALKDESPLVVGSATWALGRVGTPKTLLALKAFVNSEDEDVRENVIEAIGRIMERYKDIELNSGDFAQN